MAIALVVAEWTQLEYFLAEVFGMCMSEDVMEFDAGEFGTARSFVVNQMAVTVLQALESLSARLDIVQAVLPLNLSETLQNEFVEMRKPIRKCAGARNKVTRALGRL